MIQKYVIILFIELVTLKCTCQIRSVPPLPSLYLKIIFDFSACCLVLMLMARCISGDSKGDG